jgi:hypothetical protein
LFWFITLKQTASKDAPSLIRILNHSVSQNQAIISSRKKSPGDEWYPFASGGFGFHLLFGPFFIR